MAQRTNTISLDKHLFQSLWSSRSLGTGSRYSAFYGACFLAWEVTKRKKKKKTRKKEKDIKARINNNSNKASNICLSLNVNKHKREL